MPVFDGKWVMTPPDLSDDAFNDESTYGKLKVLIVDDQSMVANSLANSLATSGFIVKVANKIDEVKYITNLVKVDVIIIEYAFKNGQCVEEIKNIKNKSRNNKVKFIVASPHDNDEIKDRCFKFGCDLYLLKPIPFQFLVNEIKLISKQDSRKSERIKCHIGFTVTIGNETYQTYATNISTDGVYLLDNEKKINPSVEQEINLEFPLPKSSELFKCIGIVVRIAETGFGVKFKDVSVNDKYRIKSEIS